jgi:hypothetical protein
MRGLQERGRSVEDTVRTAGLAVCDGMLQVIVMIEGCRKGRGIVVAGALRNKVLLGLGAMGMGTNGGLATFSCHPLPSSR